MKRYVVIVFFIIIPLFAISKAAEELVETIDHSDNSPTAKIAHNVGAYP